MDLLLITLIQSVFNVLYIALLARVLLSWFNVDPYSPLMQFLYRFTEPILQPIRQILPQMGMFDLSPLVAFFAIRILQVLLIEVIRALFI